MIKNNIRRMDVSELKDVYKQIEQDFMKGEYPPYEVLCHHIENGIQDGLIFCKDGKDVAYSVCAAQNTNEYVLVSLLAVYKEFRGHGIGSSFIKQMGTIYKDKKGIIVEVEKPEDASNYEERTIRIKRIEFYKNAGFYMIPDISYSIWDIPMHLMVQPVNASIDTINKEIGQVMYEIYLHLMKRYIHKMKFAYR